MLSTVAVDNFALPGDAGFPLNALYHAPASRADSGESLFLFSSTLSLFVSSFFASDASYAGVMNNFTLNALSRS